MNGIPQQLAAKKNPLSSRRTAPVLPEPESAQNPASTLSLTKSSFGFTQPCLLIPCFFFRALEKFKDKVDIACAVLAGD
jgi:hypothetical protein